MAIIQLTEQTDDMSMDGWALTTVFLARWQANLVGDDLLGVYPDRAGADNAVRRRAAQGHSGAKSEPATQNGCVLEFRAITRGDQFIPIGDWFDDATMDMRPDRETEAPHAEYIVYTFGDAPYEGVRA